MLIKIGTLKQQSYKNIFEKATPNLHNRIFKFLKPLLKSNFHVLDFGCGEGAFAQRIIDLGIKTDVCDIDIQQVKANADKIIPIDINKPSLKDNFEKKYDCVVALEIIEHIENPWKFMRDIKELLNNEGIAVISTPNISNFGSRLRFFMRGTFLGFEKPDLSYGHITPLNYFQLEHIFEQTGYEIITKDYAGDFPLIHIYNFSFFNLLRNSILPFFYPFMRGPKNGRSVFYILKKRN